MIENKLITGLDIDLSTYNLGIIKQPTIEQLIKLPFKDSEIVSPFIMIEEYYQRLNDLSENNDKFVDFSRLDCLNPLEQISKQLISDEIEKEQKTNYNDIFLHKKIRYSFLDIFFSILIIVFDCNQEDIIIQNVENEINIVIKDKAIINKDNIEIFNKVMLKIFDIDIDSLLLNDEEDKWREVTGSKEEKELIKKFKEKEKKRRKKNTLHLCDFINIVVNRDGRDYKDILNWTFYQLMTSFKVGILREKRDIGLSMLVTGKYGLKMEDIVDWQKESKIDIDNSIY